MSQEFARLFITVVATLLVARQAARAMPGSRRRQAFVLTAAGFGMLAAGNALPLLGVPSPLLLTLLVGVGLALLLGSLATLFIAYREGELRDQFRRAGSGAAQKRERRDQRP
jgi:hypothetical protein